MRNAAVVFTDRIIGLGPAAELRRAHPDARAEDLGQMCILPALVNAHAHLELSHHTPGPPPRSFTDWLLRLAPGVVGSTPSPDIPATLTHACDSCIKYGVATVGDITTQPAAVRPCLARSRLRIISYGEIRAMAARKHLLEERLAAAVDVATSSRRIFPAISPHAPYSIDRHGYERCLQTARQHNLPLATHLAETPHEAQFLADHVGPFRDLWQTIGGWDDSVPRFRGGPIRYAQSIGLLDYPTLLAHVNYADDDELDILSHGRASVVYCPRTHAHFSHPPHRWRDMLVRGINVALGTDSTASSPDLNLLADMRLLHRIAPEVPPLVLWKMATLNAARALTVDAHVGSLTPTKFADMAVFACCGVDPLAQLLQSDSLPARLYISGALARL